MKKDGCPRGMYREKGICKKVEFQDVYSNLLHDKSLHKKLCKVPHFWGIGIGGGLSYRGETENDIDLIPKFTSSFLDLTEKKQIELLERVHELLPDILFGLPVDKGFFEVVGEYDSLIKFGQIDMDAGSPIFKDYAWDFDDDLLMREGQESIENIEVFRCNE